MATVFKRREYRAIPEGAEIITYRGKRCAKWTNAKTGRAQRAPLNEAGDKIILEAQFYTIQHFDHEGKRKKVSTRYADKDAAKQYANQLEKEAEDRRRGMIDPEQEKLLNEGQRPLSEHRTDFENAMRSPGRTEKYVTQTIRYIRQIAKASEWTILADISADDVNRFAGDLTEKGLSARSVQARLTAVKSFTKWLTAHGKLARNPLMSVKSPSPKADRRYERRMLLPDEWDWLRSTTANGTERFGITGHERVLLYATAIQTGLRSGECRSLTRGRLFLDGERPYVTCKARSTKNKKDARQYIQPDLAAELKAHIATKAPKAPVFAMPREANVVKMVREDLAAARREWLKSTKDPEERIRREQSDFLEATNHDGEKADFHCLRHTTGAWLAMNGEHPKVVQTVMRHGSITLTMDTYGHLFPGQEADAVANMPSILGGDSDAPESLRATGTDGETAQDPWVQKREQLSGKTWLDPASDGEDQNVKSDGDDCDNSLPIVTLSEHRRGTARDGESSAKMIVDQILDLPTSEREFALNVGFCTDE